jgi:hypothetical protein
MKNDRDELIDRIDILRDVLNQVCVIDSINSDVIIEISEELDRLIIEYLLLANGG